MSKHRSPKIEDFAYEFLQSHYRAIYTASTIKVKHKVKTKADAEVDGLLLFDTVDNAPFCAAVVTATSSSLANLLTRYKKKGLSKYPFLTAGIVLIIATFFLSDILHWGIAAAMAIVAAFATLIIHSTVETNQLKKKISAIVDNLNSFPANEQWLGISISSLTFRNNHLAHYLVSLCRQKGIGILTVGQRAKVVLMQEPKAVQSQGSNFVTNYEIAAEPAAKSEEDKKRPGSNLKVA